MKNQRRLNPEWWTEDFAPNESVFGIVEHLDDVQSHVRDSNLHHLRLYSNRMASGLGGREYALNLSDDRLRINVVKSVIDAAIAHQATNRPKPQFLTSGGSFEERKRAQRLTKFISGQFYATRFYETALEVFSDACIFGTGVIKVFEDQGEIGIERVFPDELLVDENDARYGRPRSLYQHKEIDIGVLKQAFPKESDAIEQSSLIRDEASFDKPDHKVSVVEAWHLPSGKGAKDGRHVIAVSGATLLDEEWESDRFPFAVFRWSSSPLGFWGTGLAEELSPIQTEINYTAMRLQKIMNLATPTVWAAKGSGIKKIDNREFAIREYNGRPPVFQPAVTGGREFIDYINVLEAKAYALAGISQLAARSEKPSGLNSGTALQTYNDIGSKRFQHVGQRWEQFAIDVAHLMLDCARRIEERGDGDLKVLCQGDGEVEEIKFSEVSIDRDKYVTRVFPTSLLPDTPSGKLDMVEKLAQISPDIGPHLMGLLTGIPDVEAVAKRATAPIDLANKMIERILEHGEYRPPLPTMDLAVSRNEGQRALMQAEIDNAPEENLDLLRQWLEAIDRLDEMAQAQAAPVPQAPAPQPGAQQQLPTDQMMPPELAGLPVM